jgi:PAS domain S-box-containing protein
LIRDRNSLSYFFMASPIALLMLSACESEAHKLIAMLEAANHQSWHVTGLQQRGDVLNSLSQTQFDIALLDLAATNINSLNIITSIKALAPDLPIVILGDSSDPQVSSQALAYGAQDYLIKAQITTDVLVRVIQNAIERGQILRQLQAEVAERKRSEQTLRLIVEGTAAVTGEAFFQALVRSLAEVLNVRYALVSGCIDTPPTRVCTYAFWLGSEFGENVEYDLYGTPCEKVFSSKECQFYSQGVTAVFPNDPSLRALKAESYAGVQLFGSQGQTLGHLAVVDDQVLGNESSNIAILELFATRAAAEIERQQVEEALRISQEKFAKAFRASPSAITISTLDNGRYIEVNETCLQLLGYHPEEMIGFTTTELRIWVNPSDRQRLKQRIQAEGRVTNLEAQFRKKSGEVFTGLISAEVIQLEATPCLLATTTDITLLKEGSKALEQLAEIGELASMIVHEIRNPLTTVLMGLNAFQRLELPERYQTYCSLALDEGERLQRLLNQILLYAKPQHLKRSTVELNTLITQMQKPLATMPAAGGKHLMFTAASESVQVLADPDKLKQVVINLVTNAFEAIEQGESVAIAIKSLSRQRACITVQNQGHPIPAEVLPKLSQPFITTKSNGTGLGLAIVKRIVEAHGGQLAIESTAIAGTLITVELPTENP